MNTLASQLAAEFARRRVSMYRRDRIPGGLGDTAEPQDFDREQMAKGVRVEMEHTSDPRIALEIVLDHLRENPRYYDALDKLKLARMFAREFAVRKYAKQFVESEHPRDEEGKFTVAGRLLSESESEARVAEIRAGDKRSKNEGRISPERHVGRLVESQIPTNIFDSVEDEDYGNVTEFLRATTNPDRVGSYKVQKIDTPIYVTETKSGRPVLSDGGHRLIAAIERGDDFINALIPESLHQKLWGQREN